MLNKKVEDAINAQINAEMWSAYLYLSMSAWASANNMPGVGHWFDIQYQEETDHMKIFFQLCHPARWPRDAETYRGCTDRVEVAARPL